LRESALLVIVTGKKGDFVMTANWFKPWGWIYRPVSLAGVVVTVLILAFCVQVFFAVDSRSHSVTDTLYNVFPYIVCSLTILNWIAGKTSRAT
jgi:hypothetical protein